MRPDFYNSPRYQRMLQRYQRMTPEQRAIVSTAAADEQFGSDDMRKQLQLMELGMRKKHFEDSLEFSKQRFNAEHEMRRGVFDFRQGQERKGEMLGLANLAAAGTLGYMGYKSTIDDVVRRKLLEFTLLKNIGRTLGSPIDSNLGGGY